jgi:hypothetical protein
MCAINPTHKVRYVIDVYTSNKMTRKEFDDAVLDALLGAEVKLNTDHADLRFHIKESEQEAE